jgi:hypothetical protein
MAISKRDRKKGTGKKENHCAISPVFLLSTKKNKKCVEI